jgi:nucleoside 2-deoxyribosyltransferase
MKIAICSSAVFAKQSREIKEKLEKIGLEAFLYPQSVRLRHKTVDVSEYYLMRKKKLTPELLDVKRQLMDKHFATIRECDAILVLNFDRQRKRGYVGGNTFLEMGIAYWLGKKVYIWKKPSKRLPYFEEIMAINPINIEESVERIVQNSEQ